jgi:hypothetical protein
MCCAAWLWFKTGDRPLALGSIVVANLVGCGLLFGRRSEP